MEYQTALFDCDLITSDRWNLIRSFFFKDSNFQTLSITFSG